MYLKRGSCILKEICGFEKCSRKLKKFEILKNDHQFDKNMKFRIKNINNKTSKNLTKKQQKETREKSGMLLLKAS